MTDEHNPDGPTPEHGDPDRQLTKQAIGSLLVPAGIIPSPGATVEELTAMVDDAGLIPEAALSVARAENAEEPHRIPVQAQSSEQELSMADTVELIIEGPASP